MRPEKGLKKFRQVTKYQHLRSDGMTRRHNGGTRAMEDRIMKKVSSHKFVPFELDPEVCDTCGKLSEKHNSDVMIEYREYVWRFLLKHGYVHSFYGGHNGSAMSHVLAHMRVCHVDWGRTEDPKAGTMAEFTDTDSPSERVKKFFGVLCCECGAVAHQEICIDDMTLGQIIWHVVNGK